MIESFIYKKKLFLKSRGDNFENHPFFFCLKQSIVSWIRGRSVFINIRMMKVIKKKNKSIQTKKLSTNEKKEQYLKHTLLARENGYTERFIFRDF
jgi:hypothetical protein